MSFVTHAGLFSQVSEPPVITGTAYQGSTITSTVSSQWYLNGSPISGETGSSLTVPESVLLGDEITQAGSNIVTVVRIPTAIGIRVKTDNAGSASNRMVIPARNTSTYNCRVYWGDGTYSDVTTWDSANLTHDYASAGQYDIQINGTFRAFFFNNTGDRLKLISFDQWGNTGITDFQSAFYRCSNVVIAATDHGSFSHSATNFSAAWRGCPALTSFPALDVSSGTNFQNAWRDCGSIPTFSTRSFDLLSDGTDIFLSSTLSTADYSAILIYIEANNPNNNVTFHGGSSKYNAGAAAARAALVSRGWTITDGGLE